MSRWLMCFSLLGSLVLPALSWAATKTCLTGADPSVAADAGQIAAVRAQVDMTCVCASFDGSPGKTHGKYVSCTRSVINGQAIAGQLRNQCKATVKKYYSTSTCGKPASKNEAPCIKTTAAGKVSCSIQPTGRCAESGRVACTGVTMCVDAADTNHDGLIGVGDNGACASSDSRPTSTPTSQAGVPSPTNTPTPRSDPRLCGNGTVDAGEQCDGQSFCGSDCGLLPIASSACCQFDFTESTPLSMCRGASGSISDSGLYYSCFVPGGQPSRGRECIPCTGPCPQVTPPPQIPPGSGLIQGTCQGSTFAPASVCCQGQTSCTAQIVGSSEDLAGFVHWCGTFGGSLVPVVAGTCSVSGTCITP